MFVNVIAKVTGLARSCNQLNQQLCKKANDSKHHVCPAICYYYDHEVLNSQF